MNLPPSPGTPPAETRADDATQELATRARAGVAGLRVRLWLACLLAAGAGAAGVFVIAATQTAGDAMFDPTLLGIWPWSIAGACLVAGVALALWLDHGIVRPLRAINRSLADAEVEELRGLGPGWGEIGLLAEQVQHSVGHEQERTRAMREVELIRRRLSQVRGALDGRDPGVPWPGLGAGHGPLAGLAEAIDRAFARDDAARARDRDVVLERREMLEASRIEARDSAEQAERGFVEATALLTSVRELQRLTGELQHELGEPAPTPAAGEDPAQRQRAAATEAIEELVEASARSVEHLGAGMMRVRDLADQVHLLSNRATLIALNVVVAGGRADTRRDEVTQDLKALARDVRALTDRTQALAAGIDAEVAAATERMREVRLRVAARLESAPAVEAAPRAAAAGGDGSRRLLERMREMVQDATRKGERLSQAGERASRAAERLAKRLEEEGRAIEALIGVPTPLPESPARPGTPELHLLDRPERTDSDARGRGERA